jgi:hypothetical protein
MITTGYSFKTKTNEGLTSKTFVGLYDDGNGVLIRQRFLTFIEFSEFNLLKRIGTLNYYEKTIFLKLSTFSKINNIVITLLNEKQNEPGHR